MRRHSQRQKHRHPHRPSSPHPPPARSHALPASQPDRSPKHHERNSKNRPPPKQDNPGSERENSSHSVERKKPPNPNLPMQRHRPPSKHRRRSGNAVATGCEIASVTAGCRFSPTNRFSATCKTTFTTSGKPRQKAQGVLEAHEAPCRRAHPLPPMVQTPPRRAEMRKLQQNQQK